MVSALRRSGVIGTVGATLVMLGAASAIAADPPGTVKLTTAVSAFPANLSVVLATPNWVFYNTDTASKAKPVGGGAAKTVAGPYALISAFGDTAWFDDGSGRMSTNVATSSTPVAVPDQWQVQSPDGGLYLHTAGDGKVHLYDATSTPSTVDMGALPSTATDTDQIIPGPNGAAVTSYDALGHLLINYSSYSSPAMTPLASLAAYDGSDLQCYRISSTGVGCVDNATGAIIRLPLNGGALVSTAQPNSVGDLELTATTTFWISYEGDVTHLHSVPAAGGTISDNANHDVSQLAVNDTTLYITRGSTVGTAGIYSLTSAADTPTAFLIAGHAGLASTAVSLTAGRAAWADSSATNLPVWSRSLSTSGGSITAGSTVKLATPNASTFGGAGPSVSATRTAFGFYPTTGNGIGLKLNSNATNTTVPGRAFEAPTFSGTRMIFEGIAHAADNYTGRTFLYDLVHKTLTNLSTAVGAKPYTLLGLSGDYVAYAKSDGSIWRKKLGSSTATKLVNALPTGYHLDGANVWASGDWVVWQRDIEHNGNFSRSLGLRNARAMSAIVTLAATNQLYGVSESGVLLYTGSGLAKLRTWGGTLFTLPDSLLPPSVDGSIVGWVGHDFLPRVSPLGKHVADRPRSLGNPFVGHALKLGNTWRLDLVTSAALGTCSVKIKNSSHVLVRSLPCGAAAAKQGEIQVSWDGKNATGHRVSPGTFSWTVVAGNSDGALLSEDGTTSATTGNITVTS